KPLPSGWDQSCESAAQTVPRVPTASNCLSRESLARSTPRLDVCSVCAALTKAWSQYKSCSVLVFRGAQIPQCRSMVTSISRAAGRRKRCGERSYTSCRPYGDVVWYEITGGGHRWPPETVSDAGSQAENGVSSLDLNASEVIWAFFSNHARR